jgi:hypothetical protein
MARDFYPMFSFEGGGDMDNHFWLKTVVDYIPKKELNELNHF